MTQEDKKLLLLKDLCMRLPYGVICHYNCVIRCDTMEIKKANCVGKLEGIIPVNDHIGFMIGGDRVNALFDDIKPFLRSMSSMTEEEEIAYYKTWYDPLFNLATRQHTREEEPMMFAKAHYDSIAFLLENHFDFLGLIPLGLAIEVTESNNPYKE